MIGRAARIHFGMIFAPSIRGIYEAHADELSSYTRTFYEESNDIPKDAFVEGLELEARIYAPLGEVLERFDALLCPTFGVPAYAADHDNGDPVEVNGTVHEDWVETLMTVPFNVASRCPVVSVPSGLSKSGVPTGLSVVGRTYDDVTAFRVAAAHEDRFRLLDAPDRRPSL
jgi:aspartyl-tRNA(Asn)/glutamyl-tRNA(Gln) amidotransferase subunit A